MIWCAMAFDGGSLMDIFSLDKFCYILLEKCVLYRDKCLGLQVSVGTNLVLHFNKSINR